MPTESRTTSVVAALSVAVAVVGHVLVGGGGVPLDVVPPLAALAGACWLLGEYLAGERLLTALVLAAVQLFVHVTLDSASMHDGMAMSPGIGGSLMMSATHLSVLLAGVLAVSQAQRWVSRVVRIFARFLPRLPVLYPVPGRSRRFVVVSSPVRLAASWLESNVSRRGPPGVRVIAAV
ncbi:hypothetical protein [Kribbella jiaozuonensis]|uniref:Uncharacterized protein n=1 Tax=Kribbella jiaozuonensis TaxID=2575441 RepID=A0A4U3LGX3_9ACTN|nr:hypothetical protein [Kribbella jiaozuonensis]TKK74562.1 hypothetical protein FDA38_38045 [Kribbella jiaozuonensis]